MTDFLNCLRHIHLIFSDKKEPLGHVALFKIIHSSVYLHEFLKYKFCAIEKLLIFCSQFLDLVYGIIHSIILSGLFVCGSSGLSQHNSWETPVDFPGFGSGWQWIHWNDGTGNNESSANTTIQFLAQPYFGLDKNIASEFHGFRSL
jgi:hypothetical protein